MLASREKYLWLEENPQPLNHEVNVLTTLPPQIQSNPVRFFFHLIYFRANTRTRKMTKEPLGMSITTTRRTKRRSRQRRR